MKRLFVALLSVFLLNSIEASAQELDTEQSRISIDEDFSTPADSLTDGYGKFEYSSTNSGGAQVADGRLVIEGNHREGDQLFFLPSQVAIGEDQFPGKVKLTVLAGSKERGGEGAWHLGIFIGNVKLVVHPGFRGGSVRLETVDEHRPLIETVALPYTPKVGVLYELSLVVLKIKSGCLVQLAIKNPETQETFKKNFKIAANDLGPIDRVGIGRSGRTGSDAIFKSLKIEIDP